MNKHRALSQPVGEKPESLVQRAIEVVRSHMQSEGLHVGDSLPGEGYFADEIGVSRAVMREAFGALAAMGLINVSNGRRARVGAINGAVIATSLDHGISTAQITMDQVWDVRQTIERRTAGLAASNRTEEQASEILRLAESLAEAQGQDELTRIDIAFHQAIAAASGNSLFVQIVASFESLMASAVPAAWQTRTDDVQREAILKHHLAVAAAIVAGDAEAAEQAMDGHFDASIGALLRDLSQGAGP